MLLPMLHILSSLIINMGSIPNSHLIFIEKEKCIMSRLSASRNKNDGAKTSNRKTTHIYQANKVVR